MSDVTYKMFGSTGSNTDSVATVDIQDDGFIEALYVDLSAGGMDGLSDQCEAEISFGSSNTFSTNDARASIITVRQVQNFLTSGGGALGKAAFVSFSRGIPVNAGERIHMHVQMSTGVTITVHAYLYVATTRGVTRRAVRRRR